MRKPLPPEAMTAFFAPRIRQVIEFWDQNPEALREMQQAILSAKGAHMRHRTIQQSNVSDEVDSTEQAISQEDHEEYLASVRDSLTQRRDWATRIALMIGKIQVPEADEVRGLLENHKAMCDSLRHQIQSHTRSSVESLVTSEADLDGIEESIKRLVAYIASM